MSAKCIFIEPSDVWLFRDGRPFSPNERGRAVSLFPPTPQTMQGIIRSARLAHSGASFQDRSTWPADLGTPNDFGALRLRGPLVAKWEGNSVQRFFPLPLDITKLGNGWHILAPSSNCRFQTNWQTALQPLLPPEDSEPIKFDVGWLNETVFFAYLSGMPPTCVTPSACLFERESRFGVQIDSQPKRPTEGMLYQVEFIRVQAGVGLLVEVDGVSLLNSGLLQMGGEARAGRYNSVTTGLGLPRDGRTPQPVGDKLRFKLYFATPAIFENRWLPSWLDPQSLTGNWGGVAVQLIAAAVGRPQPIGGRDISKPDSQRPIRSAVPAGSVYFFETEASADDIFKAFDGQCMSDLGADRQIGFGLCYIGGW